jgi:hypothetical protein
MQSTALRIKKLIEALSMTIYSFSNECGYVGASTIWNIIDKNKKPNKNTIDKICDRFPQVNREWLITGYGSMFIKTSAKEDEELTVTAKQVLDRLQPLIPDFSLIEKATQTMNDFINNYNHVKEFVNNFEATWQKSLIELEKVKKDIENIDAKITTITMMKGYEILEEDEKKLREKNGNGEK